MVTAKQQAYLTAMGVDVYVRRDRSPPLSSPTITGENALMKPLPVTLPVADNGNVPADVEWEGLIQQVQQCTLCDLHTTRTQTVFGVGKRTASLMFIGEAPGAEEDRQGEPFVGNAGQLLNEMLRAIRLQRADVYIANILKCRPPGNRDPKPEEAALCAPYLQRQIELIQPKLLIAVGRIAAQRLLQTDTALARLRLKQHLHPVFNIPVIVTYHPAYLLRTPQDKRKAWEDLLFIEKCLQQTSN
jgi:DNA polymerase